MKTSKNKEEKIQNLLTRNVETVIEAKHLETMLRSGKKLRVKLGIDPTSPDLHLGHAVVLRKLREFQDLGHKAVLIIGDFTARIGDPSGRDKTRPPLTEAEIKKNLKDYLRQAGKVIDIKKAEIAPNNKWLGKLTAAKMLSILSEVSVQQIIERDDFSKRLASHATIRLHEIIYPVLVAYDSVAVKADVELGGTDQTFNLLVGRDLMEKMKMKPQDVMTAQLLVGLDGERKMSKSLGNYIGLDDTANDMFGKVMSIPDSLVANYFQLATTLSEGEIKNILEPLMAGAFAGSGWKTVKMRLAFEIVKLYYDEKKAQRAQENFESTFSKKEIADDVPVLKLKKGENSAIEIVMASNIFSSKSEAWRLIEQGGFEAAGKTIKVPGEMIMLKTGDPIRVGKKRFFRVKI